MIEQETMKEHDVVFNRLSLELLRGDKMEAEPDLHRLLLVDEAISIQPQRYAQVLQDMRGLEELGVSKQELTALGFPKLLVHPHITD